MAAKRLKIAAVRDLIHSDSFREWWSRLEKARRRYDDAKEAYEELLTQHNLVSFRAELAQRNAGDRLFEAGEIEDSAAKLVAEAADFDNRSFRLLGEFEEQRVKVSNLWYKIGGNEQSLKEMQDEVDRLAAEGVKNPAKKAEARRKDEELKNLRRQYRKASEEYEREAAKKNRMWAEVENFWSRALQYNLGMSERQRRSERVRRIAERLFQQAEVNKERGQRVKEEADKVQQRVAEAEKEIANLLEDARVRFDCLLEEDFLYWQQDEDNKRVYCVPLISDSETYNIEIRALTLYQADRTQGCNFIEVVAPERPTAEAGDRRLDAFFGA